MKTNFVMFAVVLSCSMANATNGMNCAGIEGGVALGADGTLFAQKNGKLNSLIPTLNTPTKVVYGNPSGKPTRMGINYAYTIDKKEGLPATLTVDEKSMIGLDVGSSRLVYDVGVSDGNCFVKSIKNPAQKVVYFQYDLCAKLSALYAKMAPRDREELERCAPIISQMSDAIKSYKATLPAGWTTEAGKITNPFEQALAFAGDCTKQLGHPGPTSPSLSIPYEKAAASGVAR